MANVRYYRKFSPNVKLFVPMPNNQNLEIKFDTVDGVLAWYATDQEFLHQAFEQMMREQRGGITEVSQEEFEREFSQKKRPSQTQGSQVWREELLRSGLRQSQDPSARLGSESLATALRVNGSGDVRRNNKAHLETPPTEPKRMDGATLADAGDAPDATPAQKQEFVPNVGKRKTPPPRR